PHRGWSDRTSFRRHCRCRRRRCRRFPSPRRTSPDPCLSPGTLLYELSMTGIRRRDLITGVAAALIAGTLCPSGFAAPRGASAVDEAPLEVTALGPWSVVLQWSTPPEVASIEIRRDGWLLDDVAASGGPTMSYPVGCVRYDCGTSVSFAIPRYAAPSTGSDHHLTVLDPATNNELDMWLATYDAGAASWTAGSRYVTASNGWGAQCSPGQRCQ